MLKFFFIMIIFTCGCQIYLAAQLVRHDYKIEYNGRQDLSEKCSLVKDKATGFFYFAFTKKKYPDYESLYGAYKFQRIKDSIFITTAPVSANHKLQTNASFKNRQYVLNKLDSSGSLDLFESFTTESEPHYSSVSYFIGDTILIKNMQRIKCYLFKEREKSSYVIDAKKKNFRLIFLRKSDLLPIRIIDNFGDSETTYALE